MKKILLLILMMFACLNLIHPVTPQMLLEKDAPEYLFGLAFATMSLGTLIGAPFWGNIIDKYGTKYVMTFPLFVYVIGQAGFFYFESVPAMLLSRLIAGLCASAFIVGSTGYLNLISDETNKAKNFGLQFVALNIGTITGQMLGGFIGNYHIAYPLFMQIIFISALVVMTLFMFENKFPEIKVTKKKNYFKSLKMLTQKNYLFVLLAMAMIATLSNLNRSAIAMFSADMLHFDPLQISMVASFTSFLAMISALYLVDILDKKYNYFKINYIKFIVSIISIVILIFSLTNLMNSEHLILLILFFASLGAIALFVNIYRPITQKFMLSNKTFDPGEIIGVITSFNSIGMMLGSLTLGVSYGFGPFIPFYIMLIYAILGLSFNFIANKQLGDS
ncbi:MAG: MFS transporter [Mycoplasmatales bacterium]